MTQTNLLHTDPGAADDQVIALGVGRFSQVANLPFSLSALAANPMSVDPVTGSVTVTGLLTGATAYAGNVPTTFSPAYELSLLGFTPPAVKLANTASIESTLTVTATDALGGSASSSVKVFTYNRINLAMAPDTPAVLPLGAAITAPALAVHGAPGQPQPTDAITVSVSAKFVLHSDPGMADDTVTDLGPGHWGTFTASAVSGFGGDATNQPVVDDQTGTLTATGHLADATTGTRNPVTGLYAAHEYSPLAEITNTPLAPPISALTGTQALEVDYTYVATDSLGNSATTHAAVLYTKPDAPSAVPAVDGSVGTIAPTPAAPPTVPATAAVYRFFDSQTGTHFFTASSGERDSLLASRPDMTEETNGFGAVSAGSADAVAVYRFFDTAHGTQFLTADAGERDAVQALRPDLTYEAADVFYEQGVAGAGAQPVYRFFDTAHGTHFYTGNQSEYDAITTVGAAYRPDLTSEGIAFYAPSGTFK